MRIRTAAILLMCLCLAGCGRAPVASSPLPIERIEAPTRQFTTQRSSLRVVVRDAATWQSIWTQTFLGREPAPPLPFVNFDDEMIVVAALGEQPSSGYDIRIESAFVDGAGTRVDLKVLSPGGNCSVAIVMTQPVDFARVPRRLGPLRFVESKGATRCD